VTLGKVNIRVLFHFILQSSFRTYVTTPKGHLILLDPGVGMAAFSVRPVTLRHSRLSPTCIHWGRGGSVPAQPISG